MENMGRKKVCKGGRDKTYAEMGMHNYIHYGEVSLTKHKIHFHTYCSKGDTDGMLSHAE